MKRPKSGAGEIMIPDEALIPKFDPAVDDYVEITIIRPNNGPPLPPMAKQMIHDVDGIVSEQPLLMHHAHMLMCRSLDFYFNMLLLEQLNAPDQGKAPKIQIARRMP